MRRYVFRDHNNCSCSQRREVRPPDRTDLNARPDNDYLTVQAPVVSTLTASLDEPDDIVSHFHIDRYVFETICFSTLIWIEDYVSGGYSHGYYKIFNSYSNVIQGVEIPNCEFLPEGSMYHDRDTAPHTDIGPEAYYRRRVYDLERRIRELEENRVIIPREELEEVRSGTFEVNGKPFKVEYFEEEIFEME